MNFLQVVASSSEKRCIAPYFPINWLIIKIIRRSYTENSHKLQLEQIQSDSRVVQFRMYSMFEINVLCSVPILFCPSLSLIVVHALAHRLLSSHRGKYPPSVRKMEWNRWHQNDWNHLQWFPQLCYLSTRPSLLCWLLPPLVPAFLPNYTHRLDASSQSLQCHPGSQVLPKRLRLTGSPVALHKVSQEEKERREEYKE